MPDDTLSAPEIRPLAAKIAAAYLRRNQLDASEVATLLSTVQAVLARLAAPPELEPEPRPVVPVRRSVTREEVICLDCGWKGKMLRRHLGVAHGLTPAEYRVRWELQPDHPLVAPSYSEQRATVAKELRLDQHLRSAVRHEPSASLMPHPRRDRRRVPGGDPD